MRISENIADITNETNMSSNETNETSFSMKRKRSLKNYGIAPYLGKSDQISHGEDFLPGLSSAELVGPTAPRIADPRI